MLRALLIRAADETGQLLFGKLAAANAAHPFRLMRRSCHLLLPRFAMLYAISCFALRHALCDLLRRDVLHFSRDHSYELDFPTPHPALSSSRFVFGGIT
jgi:hypothetical protein